MCVQHLKFIALPVPQIVGEAKKFRQSLDTPTLHYLQTFSWAFVGMDPVNVPANFKFVALPVAEIIATGVLGGGCEPPILGKRRP